MKTMTKKPITVYELPKVAAAMAKRDEMRAKRAALAAEVATAQERRNTAGEDALLLDTFIVRHLAGASSKPVNVSSTWEAG